MVLALPMVMVLKGGRGGWEIRNKGWGGRWSKTGRVEGSVDNEPSNMYNVMVTYINHGDSIGWRGGEGRGGEGRGRWGVGHRGWEGVVEAKHLGEGRVQKF